jgi:hypothetical protein
LNASAEAPRTRLGNNVSKLLNQRWADAARVDTGSVSGCGVAGGIGAVVHVRGHSGMGKTALVEAFLRDVGQRDDVVVLRGRGYEQESVPYKALDSLVDALTGHLIRMPEAEVAQLVSPGFRDSGLLAQPSPPASFRRAGTSPVQPSCFARRSRGSSSTA